MPEVKSIQAPEQAVAWAGKLKDGHPPPGLRDAHHLGDSSIRVGHVAEAESHCCYLKPIVGKRQLLSIGFDKSDAVEGLPFCRLLDRREQHFMTEVRPHDRHPLLGRPT